MKTLIQRPRKTLSGLLILALGVVAMACAGRYARENGLMPAMRLAWPGVKADIERYLVAIAGPGRSASITHLVDEAANLTEGLETSNRPMVIAVDWVGLREAAFLGVSARLSENEIGEGVAEFLNERIVNFDEAMVSLKGGF